MKKIITMFVVIAVFSSMGINVFAGSTTRNATQTEGILTEFLDAAVAGDITKMIETSIDERCPQEDRAAFLEEILEDYSGCMIDYEIDSNSFEALDGYSVMFAKTFYGNGMIIRQRFVINNNGIVELLYDSGEISEDPGAPKEQVSTSKPGNTISPMSYWQQLVASWSGTITWSGGGNGNTIYTSKFNSTESVALVLSQQQTTQYAIVTRVLSVDTVHASCTLTGAQSVSQNLTPGARNGVQLRIKNATGSYSGSNYVYGDVYNFGY